MNAISIGFWGAFFGATALAGSAAILAFSRAAPGVARTGGLSVLLCSVYALLFLGWTPALHGEALPRLQAIVAVACASVLSLLLFLLLGTFRSSRAWKRARLVVGIAGASATAGVACLPPVAGLKLAAGLAFALAGSALIAAVRSARRGERVGRLTLAALPCMCIAMAGLDWYALHPVDTPWQVHVVGAVAGMGYVLCVGSAMWARYSYLLEVRNIAVHGPDFDPVSRLPSYESADAMKAAFGARPGRGSGVVAVSISNLALVEQLHGRAAYNHAVFACASRLRKLGFVGVELLRLPEDSFVLLTHDLEDPQRLIDQARRILARLSRPVVLHAGQSGEEGGGTRWEASLGVGVLLQSLEASLDLVIFAARDVSRTAWSYDTRMAWYDEATKSPCKLPLEDL